MDISIRKAPVHVLLNMIENMNGKLLRESVASVLLEGRLNRGEKLLISNALITAVSEDYGIDGFMPDMLWEAVKAGNFVSLYRWLLWVHKRVPNHPN